MSTRLWLDLGNTRLKYHLETDDGILCDSNALCHLQAPYELLLGLMPTIKQMQPRFVGISSVLGAHVGDKIARLFKQAHLPYAFAQVTDTDSLATLYDHKKLGVDRFLQMLGVRLNSGYVVGCGTALTIDKIVDRTHIGGYILPNITLQKKALYEGTRQIKAPKDPLSVTLAPATSTQQAVDAGVLAGVVGAVWHLTGADALPIVLTGGGARALYPHLDATRACIEEDLLLAGLKVYFAR